ncbi:MAG: hypothetical protein MJ123_11285, partial [Lachnospiraceae bacterium]|nr:hypothetical protein [Lachnospiraceae bacterium]
MEKITTIGEMINDEIRRQQISIVEFAKKINCERSNVYNIFRRNNIDIELLKRISIVLNHNYFEDLAKNMDLAKPVEISDEEIKRLQSIDNFHEAVPNAFERLGIDITITHGTKQGLEKGIPVPDYFLSDFNITFTLGKTYEEKCNGFWGDRIRFTDHLDNGLTNMVCYYTLVNGVQFLNIAIVYMTEEEWYDTIRFALNEIETLYLPNT